MNRKTQPKVKAAATGAGAGIIVAEVINWAIDTYAHTPEVAGDLPTAVSGFVTFMVGAGLAWAAGYVKKSRPRG